MLNAAYRQEILAYSKRVAVLLYAVFHTFARVGIFKCIDILLAAERQISEIPIRCVIYNADIPVVVTDISAVAVTEAYGVVHTRPFLSEEIYAVSFVRQIIRFVGKKCHCPLLVVGVAFQLVVKTTPVVKRSGDHIRIIGFAELITAHRYALIPRHQ